MAEPRAAVLSALAGAFGALICCALPALLVFLGFGTTVAAVVSAVPGLVTLSQNKVWVFGFAGLLIAGSRWYALKLSPRLTPEGAACPPSLGRWTQRVWWTSVVVYGIGFFVAFALGPILLTIES